VGEERERDPALWFVTLKIFWELISDKNNEAILQILDHVQSILHMIV